MFNKLKSRKFFVFLVWCSFCIAAICKNLDPNVMNTIFQFTGFVSCIYIGGNVLSKKIDFDKKIDSE